MSELPKDRVCDCAIQPCDLHRKLFHAEALAKKAELERENLQCCNCPHLKRDHWNLGCKVELCRCTYFNHAPENPEPVEQAAPPRPLRFKKKLYEVEAYQITRELLEEVLFASPLERKSYPEGLHMANATYNPTERTISHWEGYVTTTHGQKTRVSEGDWIIAELDGSGFYPCKAEIFAQTYEPAAPAAIEQARPQPPGIKDEMGIPLCQSYDVMGIQCEGHEGHDSQHFRATETNNVFWTDKPFAAAAEPAPERTPPQKVSDAEMIVNRVLAAVGTSAEITFFHLAVKAVREYLSKMSQCASGCGHTYTGRLPEGWMQWGSEVSGKIASWCPECKNSARAVAVPEPAVQQGKHHIRESEMSELTALHDEYQEWWNTASSESPLKFTAWLERVKLRARQAEPAPTPSRPMLKLSVEHAKQLGFTPHPDAVEVLIYGVTKFEAEASALGTKEESKNA